MKRIVPFLPFIVIAGLVAFAVFGERVIGLAGDKSGSQFTEQVASFNLTMINAQPYRISIPVNATSSNLTIVAVHTQNGSASGGMKVVTNNLSFKSANEQVATVSPGGQVTGIAKGTTTVTVTYTEGNVTKTCDVPVTITAAPGT